MGRMTDDSESLPNLKSIYDTPWVKGKEEKAFTTKLGWSFYVIIYMLQNRDVLGLCISPLLYMTEDGDTTEWSPSCVERW